MLLKASGRSRRIWIDMLSLSLALDHPEPERMQSQYYNLTCTQLKKVQIICFLQDLWSCKTTTFLKRKVGDWRKLSIPVNLAMASWGEGKPLLHLKWSEPSSLNTSVHYHLDPTTLYINSKKPWSTRKDMSLKHMDSKSQGLCPFDQDQEAQISQKKPE